MNDLSEVREGMDVFNADRQKIGIVKTVKMGDPQAVTPRGQTREQAEELSAVLSPFGAPSPGQFLVRVLRVTPDRNGSVS